MSLRSASATLFEQRRPIGAGVVESKVPKWVRPVDRASAVVAAASLGSLLLLSEADASILGLGGLHELPDGVEDDTKLRVVPPLQGV